MTKVPIRDELKRDIWKQEELRADVRRVCLQIAHAFLNTLNIAVDVQDIILTGSLANYTYTKDSDFDLHILIDFADVDDNVDLVSEFVRAKADLWNQAYDISIKGHAVEVYVQDVDEIHTASGIYSILHNRWLIKPERMKHTVDQTTVDKYASFMMSLIDNAIKADDSEDIRRAKKTIRKLRKRGLESSGEFSSENLAFKKLRKNGYLKKLAAYKKDQIEKSLTI